MNEQQQLQQQQQQHKMGSATGATGGGTSGSNSAAPYMVLTQVAVPAHMMGHPNAEQLQQLQQQLQRQQQQQQNGSNANAQQQPPQILSFNQLPPQIQQQVLLQQQQQQSPNSSQQQQLLKQQMRQQQQQQQQQVKKRLSMTDVQELIKSNQLDANMMKQLLAGGTLNNASSNTVATSSGNSTSTGNNNNTPNDTSFSDLLSSFYPDSGNGSGSTTNDSNKRLFLEAQVQPVHRENNNNNNNNDSSIYCSDEDLFKFFDVDTMAEDASSSNTEPAMTNASGNKHNNNNSPKGLNFSFLEPTPMFPMPSTQSSTSNTTTQQQQQQPGSTAHPSEVASSANPSQQQKQQQQHSSSLLQQQLRQLHQQHQQQAHVSPMPAPSHVSSQGTFLGAGVPQPVPSSNTITTQNFVLPSTMVPPTVLASVCTGTKGSSGNKRSSSGGAKKKSATKKAKRCDTPQDVLMRLVKQQGHGELARIKSEDAGYDTMPSPLQLSSFGTQVVHAVHTDDVTMLGKLLACGLSPNPCNQFRDSILDLVCKRNNVTIFNCLLEHGSDIRVVDGFGRTPLHHCGWASQFSREIAEAILERDPLQLFIEDKRGQTPMEYVRADIMTEWSEFLEEMADKFWPKGGDIAKLTRPKDSRPDGTLPDPKNAVAAGLAAMISSGNISSDQFESMDEAAKKSYG